MFSPNTTLKAVLAVLSFNNGKAGRQIYVLSLNSSRTEGHFIFVSILFHLLYLWSLPTLLVVKVFELTF